MSQMSAVLDELEVSIGRRLIISRDLLPDLRAIVDDLSAPGRLDAILRSILDQPTKLERIAQNSYTHENGFDALTLLMSDKPPYTLRLHIWWPDHRSLHAEHIHNHSWDFSSAILVGAYRFQIFEVATLGHELHHYRCGFPAIGQGYKMEYLGRARVNCTFNGVMVAGGAYSLSHDTLHRVAGVPGRLTATIFLHGPFVRRTSSVFSDRLIANPARVAKTPFQTKELARTLEKYTGLNAARL
jgi:hypothetical protein